MRQDWRLSIPESAAQRRPDSAAERSPHGHFEPRESGPSRLVGHVSPCQIFRNSNVERADFVLTTVSDLATGYPRPAKRGSLVRGRLLRVICNNFACDFFPLEVQLAIRCGYCDTESGAICFRRGRFRFQPYGRPDGDWPVSHGYARSLRRCGTADTRWHAVRGRARKRRRLPGILVLRHADGQAVAAIRPKWFPCAYS